MIFRYRMIGHLILGGWITFFFNISRIKLAQKEIHLFVAHKQHFHQNFQNLKNILFIILVVLNSLEGNAIVRVFS